MHSVYLLVILSYGIYALLILICAVVGVSSLELD